MEPEILPELPHPKIRLSLRHKTKKTGSSCPPDGITRDREKGIESHTDDAPHQMWCVDSDIEEHYKLFSLDLDIEMPVGISEADATTECITHAEEAPEGEMLELEEPGEESQELETQDKQEKTTRPHRQKRASDRLTYDLPGTPSSGL